MVPIQTSLAMDSIARIDHGSHARSCPNDIVQQASARLWHARYKKEALVLITIVNNRLGSPYKANHCTQKQHRSYWTNHESVMVMTEISGSTQLK
jgi:hypothetical protein